jgi:hypothetical protein
MNFSKIMTFKGITRKNLKQVNSSYLRPKASPPPKMIKYKDVSSESGVGVRENFSLVWLVCTNHGAYIFI